MAAHRFRISMEPPRTGLLRRAGEVLRELAWNQISAGGSGLFAVRTRSAPIAFRTVGLSSWEAQALARKYAANPAWMLDIPADEVVNIQEVMLRAGPALLIEDFDDSGRVERATVMRSALDRIYAVSAANRDLSIRIANALP